MAKQKTRLSIARIDGAIKHFKEVKKKYEEVVKDTSIVVPVELSNSMLTQFNLCVDTANGVSKRVRPVKIARKNYNLAKRNGTQGLESLAKVRAEAEQILELDTTIVSVESLEKTTAMLEKSLYDLMDNVILDSLDGTTNSQGITPVVNEKPETEENPMGPESQEIKKEPQEEVQTEPTTPAAESEGNQTEATTPEAQNNPTSENQSEQSPQSMEQTQTAVAPQNPINAQNGNGNPSEGSTQSSSQGIIPANGQASNLQAQNPQSQAQTTKSSAPKTDTASKKEAQKTEKPKAGESKPNDKGDDQKKDAKGDKETPLATGAISYILAVLSFFLLIAGIVNPFMVALLVTSVAVCYTTNLAPKIKHSDWQFKKRQKKERAPRKTKDKQKDKTKSDGQEAQTTANTSIKQRSRGKSKDTSNTRTGEEDQTAQNTTPELLGVDATTNQEAKPTQSALTENKPQPELDTVNGQPAVEDSAENQSLPEIIEPQAEVEPQVETEAQAETELQPQQAIDESIRNLYSSMATAKQSPTLSMDILAQISEAGKEVIDSTKDERFLDDNVQAIVDCAQGFINEFEVARKKQEELEASDDENASKADFESHIKSSLAIYTRLDKVTQRYLDASQKQENEAENSAQNEQTSNASQSNDARER